MGSGSVITPTESAATLSVATTHFLKTIKLKIKAAARKQKVTEGKSSKRWKKTI